jgi:plasmid stabilization system protein ParE
MIHLSQEARLDIERVREFLGANNPEAAKRALLTIFAALEQLEEFPGLGRPTEDPAIPQLIIPFGARGYVARYTVRGSGDVLVLRLWHGREARSTDDT